MTVINGLIMYLAVLAVVKRVRVGGLQRVRGKAVDSVSRLVKSELGGERERERERERGLVCWAKRCK